MAVVYLEKKKYKEAIQVLATLLKEDTLRYHRDEYARIMDNLGYAQLNLGNRHEAFKNLLESLRIKDSLGIDYQKVAPLIHLARFFKDSIVTKSNVYAKKAYQIATVVDSPDDRLEALDILIRNTSNQQDFKHYYEKSSSLKDSIDLVRRVAKNEFAKIKYDSTNEIKKKEKEKEQKEKITVTLIIFIMIAILLFLLIRSRNKRDKLKIAYNTETRISKKLHDELANDVFHTMTFAATQDLQNPIKKEALIENLDQIYNRTRNISKENNQIDTGENYENNLIEMLNSYKNDTLEVIIKTGNPIEWTKINDEKKIALQRVLQEFMVNMKKYSQANFVVIGFEMFDNTVQIEYSDNGIGINEKLILKNGLQNAENRILAIKGTLTFETETKKGFRAKIIFPK